MVNLLRFLSFVRRKATPAGRVPPDAVLLPGSKSKQKCRLLAEGIFFRLVSVVSKDLKRMESGPFQGGLSVLLFRNKKTNNTELANKHYQ